MVPVERALRACALVTPQPALPLPTLHGAGAHHRARVLHREGPYTTRNRSCTASDHSQSVSQLPQTHGHDTTRARIPAPLTRASGRRTTSASTQGTVHWARWLSVHTREYECMHAHGSRMPSRTGRCGIKGPKRGGETRAGPGAVTRARLPYQPLRFLRWARAEPGVAGIPASLRLRALALRPLGEAER